VKGEESGFSDSLMLTAAGNLAPLLAWRGWCIWGRPGLLGSTEEGKAKKR